ncbi:hypothetical protein K435DRAFT_805458 [Dendrothele bispora CBS 962.96]|uniref:Uncharacterized protein n=1 Tax=Dendrothele bispora (strain CBS 962.96) TaxID=1314807 RepID=A0A4S8LCD2_DENBC|nr:hypothetical protein K435DRAFT_805458 [Dendrothele bispora CBS 962.96]
MAEALQTAAATTIVPHPITAVPTDLVEEVWSVLCLSGQLWPAKNNGSKIKHNKAEQLKATELEKNQKEVASQELNCYHKQTFSEGSDHGFLPAAQSLRCYLLHALLRRLLGPQLRPHRSGLELRLLPETYLRPHERQLGADLGPAAAQMALSAASASAPEPATGNAETGSAEAVEPISDTLKAGYLV